MYAADEGLWTETSCIQLLNNLLHIAHKLFAYIELRSNEPLLLHTNSDGMKRAHSQYKEVKHCPVLQYARSDLRMLLERTLVIMKLAAIYHVTTATGDTHLERKPVISHI